MLFKRRNKYGRTRAEQKEFDQLSSEFYAAIAKLPADWREVASGKKKLPSTLAEFRAKYG